MDIRETKYQLTPGDAYVGMCAKVYITRKDRLVFHCTLCYKCTFGSWQELLDHFSYQHEVRCIFKEQEQRCANDTQEAPWSTCQLQSQSKTEPEDVSETKNEEYNDDDNDTDDDNENFDNFEFCEVPLANAVRDIIVAQCERRPPGLYDELLETEDDSGDEFDMNLCRPGDRRLRLKTTKMGHKYFCDTCGVAFKENHALEQHKQRHIGKRVFICSECNKVFTSPYQLRTHKESKHKKPTEYVCPKCPETFFTLYAMRLHKKRYHDGPPTYSCSECGKNFFLLNKLKLHMRRHPTQAAIF